MRRPAIHPVIKSHFDKIEAAFTRAIVSFETEDIHAFRVEVKKLRAFLRLAEDGKQPILPKRLHKFYGMAGHIRNLGLQQQRIHEHFRGEPALPQSYLTLLSTEDAAASLTAGEYAKKKLSLKLEMEYLLAYAPGHLGKSDIRRFLYDTDHRLRTSIAVLPPLSDEVLHDVRKCLKDLQYNLTYVRKEATHLLPAALLEKKDQLIHLTEALGHYQDLRAGLQLLAPVYLQQIKEDNETALLETLRDRWEQDKLVAGIRLHSLLSKMLSPTVIAPVTTDLIMDAPFTT